MDVLEQVLSRLGLADRPAPSLDGLHTLYAAWCRNGPLENVRYSRAWSPFNDEVHARAIRGETMVGVARGQHVVSDGAGGGSHTPLRGDDRLRVFVAKLGRHEEIVRRLPPNTPTPPPPGSRTAQAAALGDRG